MNKIIDKAFHAHNYRLYFQGDSVDILEEILYPDQKEFREDDLVYAQRVVSMAVSTGLVEKRTINNFQIPCIAITQAGLNIMLKYGSYEKYLQNMEDKKLFKKEIEDYTKKASLWTVRNSKAAYIFGFLSTVLTGLTLHLSYQTYSLQRLQMNKVKQSVDSSKVSKIESLRRLK